MIQGSTKMRRILLSLALSVLAFVASSASAAAKPGIQDTRLWVGACPSQVVDTGKSVGAELLLLVGGRLIDAGVGALGAALTAAGNPKTVTRSASINVSSLNQINGCAVLISGRFLSNESEALGIQAAGNLVAPTDQGLNANQSVVRTALVENLNTAGIYLAEEPAIYLELQIIKSSAASFYFRPVLISFQKAILSTSWGSSGGQRDILISAALASNSGESAVPILFEFQDWEVPTHGYFGVLNSDSTPTAETKQPDLNTQPVPPLSGNTDQMPSTDMSKAGQSSDSGTGNFATGSSKKLLGGLQSAVIPVPKGSEPYRLTLTYSETREGSALLKAIGDAITADKDKIGSLVKQVAFESERQAADEKRRTETIKAREATDTATEEALKAHNVATTSLAKCKNTDRNADDAIKSEALNAYRTTRRKALTSFSKALEPQEFDISKLPEVAACPN